MASDWGVVVVVEIATGCGVASLAWAAAWAWAWAVVVVVDTGVDTGVEAATRIQQRTPRLRPRAPSTPAELVIPGFVMN